MGLLETLLLLAAGVAVIAPAALLLAAARAGRDAWGLRPVGGAGGAGPYREGVLHGWARDRVPTMVWIAAIAAVTVAIGTVGLVTLTAIEAWLATQTVKGAQMGATALDGARWAALLVWGLPYAVASVVGAGRLLRSPDRAIASATWLGWWCALFGMLLLALLHLELGSDGGARSPWVPALGTLAMIVGLLGVLVWAAEVAAWRRKLRARVSFDHPAAAAA